MEPQKAPFFENVIDESIPMQSMHPVLFDEFLQEGWRLLGQSIVRHNIAICRGGICRTLPLRINLRHFSFSKSQRQMLRRTADWDIRKEEIRLTLEKDALFQLHTSRFRERQPATLAAFLGNHAAIQPVPGYEYSVHIDNQLVACSFIHQGKKSVSGTYCFFDPEYSKLSLGTVTMLREIQDALDAGYQYYYHGYCYNVPSQFDYKLNFNSLERLDWPTMRWTPIARQVVRQWDLLV